MLALPVGYAAIASSPYRMRRITAFLEPFEHRRDAGYQITESLMGFGSGGWTGVGLGDGRQKLLFLPEAHTDFISAIIGEELGFVGVALLCTAFAWLVLRGLRAAWRVQDEYAAYLAAGMTLFIGLQAFTNLAVAMGLLPTKGLALPFVSYGGSSLVVNAAAAGVILNITRFGVSPAAQTTAGAGASPSEPRLRPAGGGAQ
jgi:cell division protein FtsW